MSSGFQIYRWPLRWPPGTRLPVAVLTNERTHNKTPLPKWFWLIWKINRCASKNGAHGIFKEDKEMNDEEGSQRFSGLAAPARSGLTFQIKRVLLLLMSGFICKHCWGLTSADLSATVHVLDATLSQDQTGLWLSINNQGMRSVTAEPPGHQMKTSRGTWGAGWKDLFWTVWNPSPNPLRSLRCRSMGWSSRSHLRLESAKTSIIYVYTELKSHATKMLELDSWGLR